MRDYPEGVALQPGRGGLPVLRINTQACRAEVYPYGAHITAWEPAGHQPVIFTSSTARYELGTAIRGGVPLCGPWFGSGLTGDRKPSHGWFRITSWLLSEVSVTDDGEVSVELTLAQDGLDCHYLIRFGARELRLELTVASVDETLELEQALHTYLAVSDSNDVTVTGLEGCEYADKVAGDVKVESGDVFFHDEVDRIYRTAEGCVLDDPGMGRQIVVDKQNSASTIVWNPGLAKAEAMADLGDEWPTMVCVEVGNVGGAAISLHPGDSHTLQASYRL